MTAFGLLGPLVIIAGIFVFSLASAIVKIMREYERAVVFRLG